MVEFGVPFQPPRQELSDSATLLVTALDLSHIWRTTVADLLADHTAIGGVSSVG